MTAPARFELREEAGRDGPATVVALSGEVDAGNATDLERALRAITARGPMILDLSALDYFDSAGFGLLDRLLGEGGTLVVISPQSVLRAAASIMMVPLHDSIADAEGALAGA